MTKSGRSASVKRDMDDIIQTCDAIESRKFNPFLLDISEALRILRLHSEHLKSLQDHLLDMRALSKIARVVGLQSANLRFQSSSLFVDPETVKQKIESLSKQQLAEFLLLSWHPIVEIEQLTSATVKEALSYWNQLLSFFERRRRLDLGPLTAPSAAGLEELGEAGLVEAKTFNKRLLEFWDELRQRVSPNGVIDYWSFVRTSQFSETVARAQFVSFLVTYGYATMQRDGDNIILRPNEKPSLSTSGSPLSFPISIPREGS